MEFHNKGTGESERGKERGMTEGGKLLGKDQVQSSKDSITIIGLASNIFENRHCVGAFQVSWREVQTTKFNFSLKGFSI